MDENKVEFIEITEDEAEGLVDELDEELTDGFDEFSDEQEPEGFFDKAREKAEDIFEELSDISYHKYTEPDENTVIPNKKAWIIFGSCIAAFVLLAVGAYYFFTGYDYYTTGYSTKDFIERFNSLAIIPEGSDIYETYPSATDIFIPEDAKLGGKNKIELYDGHVTIEADTRLGRIEKLYVRNVDIPGYDRETFEFSNCGDDVVEYFEIVGKSCAVFGSGDPSIEQVINAGVQLYQYSAMYYMYGGDGTFYVDLGNNRVTYRVEDACMYVEPIHRKITAAVWPDWLKKKEKPEAVIDEVPASSEVSSADVSSSEVSASSVN